MEKDLTEGDVCKIVKTKQMVGDDDNEDEDDDEDVGHSANHDTSCSVLRLSSVLGPGSITLFAMPVEESFQGTMMDLAPEFCLCAGTPDREMPVLFFLF